MYSIAYVVPYFGKLPKGFEFWLLSCKCNPTIDWLVYTDDRTEYDYPDNVKVTYCSFDQIKARIQETFDFSISLERPYKLCDYKPAYGEIFQKDLKEYDFWGHCDIDLVWGNIRKFYTNDILNQFERVGFNGHSNLYKNIDAVNSRFRTLIDGTANYREVYATDKSYAFDEVGMDAIYESLGIPVYKEIDFANLLKYDYGFYLDWQPKEEADNNRYQVFTWENGVLTRHYLSNGELQRKEYMYLHYWCRPTTFRVKEYKVDQQYLIYADVTTDKKYEISAQIVRKKSKKNPAVYYIKSFWANRKKLTINRIIFNVRGMFKYRAN